MRCSTHDESETCLRAIMAGRTKEILLPRVPRARRNAQDWVKLLSYTPFFALRAGPNAGISLSVHGRAHSSHLDRMCEALRQPESFWSPVGELSQRRLNWYLFYGSVDVGHDLSGEMVSRGESPNEGEFPGGDPGDEIRGLDSGSHRSIRLREFDPAALGGARRGMGQGTTIESSYDSGLASRSHRLHDEMVVLIGNVCLSKGALVYDDPQSVDLLVSFEGVEFIIEVKSVTATTVVNRLRYAIGQVSHYDYIRSQEAKRPRRKVVGLAARLPSDAWFFQFLTDHLDMDLLSLYESTLRIDSNSGIAQRLFTVV